MTEADRKAALTLMLMANSDEAEYVPMEYVPKQQWWQGGRQRKWWQEGDEEDRWWEEPSYKEGLGLRFNNARFSGIGIDGVRETNFEGVAALPRDDTNRDLMAMGIVPAHDNRDQESVWRRHMQKRAKHSVEVGKAQAREAHTEYRKWLKKNKYRVQGNAMDIEMDEEVVKGYAKGMGSHRVEVMFSNEREEVAAHELEPSIEGNLADWEAFEKERATFKEAFELRESLGYEVGALLECVDFKNSAFQKGLVSAEELAKDTLPYPLCKLSFVKEYVEPLFQERDWSQGTLLERLVACEGLAQKLLGEVDAIDEQWQDMQAMMQKKWLNEDTQYKSCSGVSPLRTHAICKLALEELKMKVFNADEEQKKSARWRFRAAVAIERATGRRDAQLEGRPILATDLPEPELLVDRNPERARLAQAGIARIRAMMNNLKDRMEEEIAAAGAAV